MASKVWQANILQLSGRPETFRFVGILAKQAGATLQPEPFWVTEHLPHQQCYLTELEKAGWLLKRFCHMTAVHEGELFVELWSPTEWVVCSIQDGRIGYNRATKPSLKAAKRHHEMQTQILKYSPKEVIQDIVNPNRIGIHP